MHSFLRGCRRDPRHFGECRACQGYGSPRTHLKKGLVPHSRVWWGVLQRPLSFSQSTRVFNRQKFLHSPRSPFLDNAQNITIFTNPSTRAGYDIRSIFKRSLTGLNSEFSFSQINCLTKAEEPSLPYYLPIAGGRIIGFIPFPKGISAMWNASVSSRIWTRVAVSISYDVSITPRVPLTLRT